MASDSIPVEDKSPDINSYAIQQEIAGQVVNLNGTEWILLYKVPVVNPTDAKMSFYLAVEKNVSLPTATFLIAVPVL